MSNTHLAVVAASVLLVACGAPAPQVGTAPSVVTTVFPLSWMAQQIAPEAALTFLGAGGHDPHDVELGTQDRVALEQADVVAHVGPVAFQPQVEDALGDRTDGVVSILDVLGEGAFLAARDDDRLDPHIWFAPALMADVAAALGEALAAADAEAAAGYRERARAVDAQLRALNVELDQILSDCEHDEAVVSHEAYAYLLVPRGLDQHGVAGVDPEGGASPAALAELADRIRAEGITAVLAEPIEGRADAEALAREADVALLDIDPLESVTPEQAARGYPALLREQAQTFATALDCR